MRDSIKWVANRMPKSDDRQLSIMSLGNVAKARFFHSSFPQYSITPLARLDGMAKYLGLGGLFVKDESFRFGLNAFKVLGGSFAMARYIAKEMGRDVSEMTYDYLTRVHGLDNLLWVWNTNAPRDKQGDEAGPYADYYPGSEYVDILAADVYHRDYKQSHHDDLKALAGGKPIALGEVGQLPDPESYHNQPDWAWFMVWGYFINSQKSGKLDSVAAVRHIYDDPRTLTLDRIDFSDGTYRLRQ